MRIKFSKIIALILVLTILIISAYFVSSTLTLTAGNKGFQLGSGSTPATVVTKSYGIKSKVQITGTNCPVSYFLPTNSQPEWDEFKKYKPACISLCEPVQDGILSGASCGGCSKICGGGTRTCTRTCVGRSCGGGGCLSGDTYSESCNTQCCPVNGVWSGWTYSACAACGGGDECGSKSGFRAVSRTCTPPSCGGAACSYGENYYQEACSESCGGCSAGETCSGNTCVIIKECTPQCSSAGNVACGQTISGIDDGCGGTCPTVTGTDSNCGGKTCGTDACGNSCGPACAELTEGDISEDTSDEVDVSSLNRGSIICTELHRQGLMDDEIYLADEEFGTRLAEESPNVMRGYYWFATPIVEKMQESEEFAQLVNVIAKPWSEEMAYRVGHREKGNLAGAIIMNVGMIFLGIIGSLMVGQMSMIIIAGTIIFTIFVFSMIFFKRKFEK